MNNVSTSDIVEVVQKFKSYISSVCRKFYIVGGTNEDLFEEGVIGLLEACKSYNGESVLEDKFEPFAKTCIKRQIVDAIRRANALKHKALNESISFVNFDENGNEYTIADALSDRNHSNDPLELFIDKEIVSERLARCEKTLSDFENLVLNHYLNGEKQSEIARHLNKDVKSIDNTIQRIKAKFK